MKRNHPELIYQTVQSPVTLSPYRQFKYEDHGIQSNNEIGDERTAEPGVSSRMEIMRD